MVSNNHIPDQLDVAVNFGGESTGGNKVSITISIDRDQCSLKAAEHYLLQSRLQLKLVMGPDLDADVPGQELEGNLADYEVFENVGDTGDLSVKSKVFSTRLSFRRENVDDGALVPFSGNGGRLVAKRVGSAKDDHDGENESSESKDGQLALAGSAG